MERLGKDQRGQSLLEYAIVLTAVILAIAAAASGPITTALGNMFSDVQTKIEAASDRIAQ